jgi:catechol 2,3-dioxygenase-like lactoylglutathione lyase family enzyme
MLKDSPAFSGFAVDSLKTAKAFYTEKLGLAVDEDGMGLTLKLGGGTKVFVYDKPDHKPADFTILNFPVDDIDKAIDELEARGVTFEHYGGLPAPQDEKGVLRGLAANQGPDIAWFKDPAGNVLSILQNS